MLLSGLIILSNNGKIIFIGGLAMLKRVEPYKEIAAIYDEIRPSYPERLIEDCMF